MLHILIVSVHFFNVLLIYYELFYRYDCRYFMMSLYEMSLLIQQLAMSYK